MALSHGWKVTGRSHTHVQELLTLTLHQTYDEADIEKCTLTPEHGANYTTTQFQSQTIAQVLRCADRACDS